MQMKKRPDTLRRVTKEEIPLPILPKCPIGYQIKKDFDKEPECASCLAALYEICRDGREKVERIKPPIQKHPVVEHTGTVCISCGSSRRTPYTTSYSVDISGSLSGGRCYDRITHRRTRCEDCGQCRIDKEYVLLPVDGQRAKSANETQHKSRPGRKTNDE